MKYMVMECHDGYAVLMDEQAHFVHAANLHYKVGDTVTAPIIMNDQTPASKGIKMYITRAAAAAACIALVAAGGYSYYANNFKTHSTIIISSQANITMELNKKGKVLSLKSNNDTGKDVLKDYNGKGKDKTTAAKEILEIEKSKGYISEGDTVEVYVLSDDDKAVSSCISEIEQEVSAPEIKVSVKDVKDYDNARAKTTAAPVTPAAPVEPAETVKPPEPAAPPAPDANAPVPEVKQPDPIISEPAAPAAKEHEEVVPPHERKNEKANEKANNNAPDPQNDKINEHKAAEPPAPPAAAEQPPEPVKPEEVTPPTPEKPVEAVPPAAPAEENKVEPIHPEPEQREERNAIHKPHEGLPQPAHPIPDTNSIDNISPDLEEP